MFKSGANIFLLALAFVVGRICFAYAQQDIDAFRTFAMYGWLLVGYLAAVWVHQLAHVAIGVLVGLRPIAVVLWPLIVLGLPDKPKVSLSYYWDVCQGAHWYRGRSTPKGYLAFALAGPIASFLAGGLAIWVSTQHTFVRYTSFRSGWLHLLDAGPFPYIGFAVVSISIGLATLFMTRPNRLHTKQDGAVARGLLRGAEERDSVVACLEIFDIENDQRPRDWDPELLRRACAGPEGSPFRTLGMWLRVYPLFDTGQHEAARKALDEVLSVWKNQDDGPLADVWADRVYAGVLVGEPIEELSQIFNTKLPGFQDWRMFRLARAAMLLHDGKNEAALKEAGWTLHFIHEPHTGVDKFVIERLQEIAREASARLGVSEEQAPVA